MDVLQTWCSLISRFLLSYIKLEESKLPPYLLRDGIEAIDVDSSPEQAFIEDDEECDPEGRNEEVDCLTEQ